MGENKKISDQNLILSNKIKFKKNVNPPPERRNEIDGGLINKGLTM